MGGAFFHYNMEYTIFLYSKTLKKNLTKNMATVGRDCFHYMTYSKTLKIFYPKWLNGFTYNLA